MVTSCISEVDGQSKYYKIYNSCFQNWKKLQLIQFSSNRFINSHVNTNSKYKEDNFTDSDAVDYFQDVWIYFRRSAHMSPSLLRSTPPLYTSQSLCQVRRVVLVTAPTQGASWLLHDDDADTQLAVGGAYPRVPSSSCIPEAT